tara:strand:- start:1700 stop:2458 length:759 start_codon:yes stop_codon:yes gene_type:complete
MKLNVTIISAVYNSNKTIRKSIDSVIYQDYPLVEYIIVDGKSSDCSMKVIKNYLKMNLSIKLISEKDDGVYDAFNKGIEMATGDIIGFVNADDFLNSKTIISEIVSMMKSESLDGVYGDLQYIYKNNPQTIIRSWKSLDYHKSLLKKGWMPPHPTLFLKKEVYEKHGLFDLSYKISADYDFILRIFKDSELKFGYLPKVITKMRTGGISNRNLKNIIKKSIEDYRAIRSNNVGNFLTLIRKNTSKLKQFFNS